MYVHRWQSPIGEILLLSDGTSLTGLRFMDYREATAEPAEECFLPVFARTTEWLDCYFSGWIPDFIPPLVLNASPFCRAVYHAVSTIPYGETATYGAIARRLTETGMRKSASARAVGAALARNPILLIIPCHRVVGADGSLTGYAAGTERKRRLLLLEHDFGDFKKIEKYG